MGFCIFRISYTYGGKEANIMNHQFDSTPIPITNWAAIAGIWSFENAVAQYKGPTTQESLPYGIALSDVQLRDGIVQANILLDTTQDTTAGIIVGFQSESAGYVIAQLGAYNFAYALSEFTPAVSWRALAHAGSIANLKPHQSYFLEITQLG